jgi:hypothetical protein
MLWLQNAMFSVKKKIIKQQLKIIGIERVLACMKTI